MHDAEEGYKFKVKDLKEQIVSLLGSNSKRLVSVTFQNLQ